MPIGKQVLTQDPLHASGKRDKRVLIEKGSDTTDASGFPTVEFTALRYEMMARRDIRGDERHEASQDSAYAETQWYCPYRLDMDPDVVNVAKYRRLNYRGRIYDIRTATIIGRNTGLELMTLAQTNQVSG